MKTIRTLIGTCLLFCSTALIFAQEEPRKVILKTDFEIQKHTIMEQFEPAYIVSVEKRVEMKKKRIENAEYTLNVLDTMKLSNRKRKQLIHDLKYNPFSDRLNRFIVDTKFEEGDVVEQQK